MTKQEFENGFQGLLSLAKRPSTIDEFVLLYKILLIANRQFLVKARTLAEILACKAQGSRLKEVLMKQVSYTKRLRDEALIREFDTVGADLPAIDAG